VTGAAEEAGVGFSVSLSGAEAMELGTLRGQGLGAVVAEATLELALAVFELAALRGRAALVKLEALEDVTAKLEAEIGVAAGGGVDLGAGLLEDLQGLGAIFVREGGHVCAFVMPLLIKTI
jgi:hypothetical protein